MSMIPPTPTVFIGTCLLSGLIASVSFSTYSINLVARSFRRRVQWADEATLSGKARTTLLYVYNESNWRAMPKIAAVGFGAGVLLAAVVMVVVSGLWTIFG